MSRMKSSDDCFFYVYSTCMKGDDCPFRHCEAALGSQVVCSFWSKGRCIRDNCKFRHMKVQKNQATVPCHWENQPTGCLNRSCPFLHKKYKKNIPVTFKNDACAADYPEMNFDFIENKENLESPEKLRLKMLLNEKDNFYKAMLEKPKIVNKSVPPQHVHHCWIYSAFVCDSSVLLLSSCNVGN